ncbi:anthranilate synthase component II [Bacillus thuringiensis]|uniref:anthranilate synthase component II n=1 Tax=Bacillus thuringiensis TaxID=1428 RepID=UPI00333BD757
MSPGPGTPEKDEDFGICKRIINEVNIPILGICLGHQGINYCLGGEVGKAPKPVHGYKECIFNSGENIFKDLPNSFFAVRYHSLICTKLAPSLKVTAQTQDGLIMGIAHKELPIYGVQFHPESIDSEFGVELIRNFIEISMGNSYGRQLNVPDFA